MNTISSETHHSLRSPSGLSKSGLTSLGRYLMIVSVVISRATLVPGFSLDFSSCLLHPTTYLGPFVAYKLRMVSNRGDVLRSGEKMKKLDLQREVFLHSFSSFFPKIYNFPQFRGKLIFTY